MNLTKASTEKKKSFELKKHVGAIHSSNRLTLLQRKVANALLYNAYDNLLTKERHSIHIKILCNLIGYDSKDYKTVKIALISLISTVIQWNLVDSDGGGKDGSWNASSIIADATIDGPICFYSYSQNMKHLLYHPEIYGRLNMDVQAKFKSTYGLSLYENCIRYQGISQTRWFDLKTFRLLMGVEKREYPIFRDFKRRVIDKAVEEVNNYSPVELEVKLKREGRVVISLRFLITNKKKIPRCINHQISENYKEDGLLKRLTNDFLFSQKQADKAIKVYGKEYVWSKICLIEQSMSFKCGKISNLAKYLEHALKNDYRLRKSSMGSILSIELQRQEKVKVDNIRRQKIERYKRFQNEEILRLYNKELSFREKEKLRNLFSEDIKDNLYYNVYLKEGLENILVAERFCQFIRIHKTDIFDSMISFEEFFEKDKI